MKSIKPIIFSLALIFILITGCTGGPDKNQLANSGNNTSSGTNSGTTSTENLASYEKFFDSNGTQLGFCTAESQGGYMNPTKITYFDMNYKKITECIDASNSGGFKGGCSPDLNEFIIFGPADWQFPDNNVLKPQGLKYRCENHLQDTT
ncbi:MAG: hypothetical protein Q7S92_05240 [Candidatus Diapherotrites archaeon]|nr:hypothetical protein [Candidatus Diapherotrites archaeon]